MVSLELINPVSLAAGHKYVISTYINSTGGSGEKDTPTWFGASGTTMVLAPEVGAVTAYRRWSTSDSFPASEATNYPLPVGPNFTFTSGTNPIPEPSTLVGLISMGVVGLGLFVWRRRKR